MQLLSNKLCKQTIFRTCAPESCCFTGMGFYWRKEPNGTSTSIAFRAVPPEALGRRGEESPVIKQHACAHGEGGKGPHLDGW